MVFPMNLVTKCVKSDNLLSICISSNGFCLIWSQSVSEVMIYLAFAFKVMVCTIWHKVSKVMIYLAFAFQVMVFVKFCHKVC